ncbi:MAG TPA: hypothetical protein VIY08_12650 [Candidatus Nitrosocosmicus sp.]
MIFPIEIWLKILKSYFDIDEDENENIYEPGIFVRETLGNLRLVCKQMDHLVMLMIKDVYDVWNIYPDVHVVNNKIWDYIIEIYLIHMMIIDYECRVLKIRNRYNNIGIIFGKLRCVGLDYVFCKRFMKTWGQRGNIERFCSKRNREYEIFYQTYIERYYHYENLYSEPIRRNQNLPFDIISCIEFEKKEYVFPKVHEEKLIMYRDYLY